MRIYSIVYMVLAVLLGLLIVQPSIASDVPYPELTGRELLGSLIFFDTNLSSPNGQGCVSCHVPDVGFTDPDKKIPTSEGVVHKRFGSRNAPTVTYLATAPDFHFDKTTGAYIGGQFWDSHALNLKEQALQPFLNPLEMNNPDKWAVVRDVKKAYYAPLFREIYGDDIFCDVDRAFNAIGNAIAAFENSAPLNRFSSRFDHYLAGEDVLSSQELLGLQLFEGKANCFRCHVTTPNADGGPPVFTNFRFANIGVPKNPKNPFYKMSRCFNPEGKYFVDFGLGGFLRDNGEPPSVYEPQLGRMNFPTMRNIELTSPYFHNGVFSDLKTVVHFFNVRDVPGSGFGPPEVPLNVSQAVGNLQLTDEEEDAIVAFLLTLTDE